jgi:autotransporter-associated beta strand protein
LGALEFTNTTGFSTTLGTGGTINFDAADGSSATVTLNDNGPFPANGNVVIAAQSTFTDSVIAAVNQLTDSPNPLVWSGAVHASDGGFTKQGAGALRMTTNLKQYTGPTIFDTDSGFTAIEFGGRPSATSSVTVMPGAGIFLLTPGNYSFGSGPLNLNGAGPPPSVSQIGGALRNSSSFSPTVSNPIVLQSNSVIEVAGSTRILTLSNIVSGPGRLEVSGETHSSVLGRLSLQAANTYSGGTLVRAGQLSVFGTLGTGNVTVETGGTTNTAARLTISSLDNVIDDAATLSLAGGGTPNLADDGFASLGTGVDERVARLILGGIEQTTAGTYGSTATSATFQFDEYFSGTGVIRLGIPADYNGDWTVDAADYVVYRKFNGEGVALLNEVDGVTPGQVTLEDYDAWRERFGATSSASSLTLGDGAVPEPSSILMAVVGVYAICSRRARPFFWRYHLTKTGDSSALITSLYFFQGFGRWRD